MSYSTLKLCTLFLRLMSTVQMYHYSASMIPDKCIARSSRSSVKDYKPSAHPEAIYT